MFVFYLFAALLVFLSYQSLRGGIRYLNFFKTELACPQPDFAPFVSIIAPCRGSDAGLKENLAALFRQNFPAYEILFVVDDEMDEAVSVIEELSREDAKSANVKSAKLINAGRAKNESQKVHNLREAVRHVDERSEIFVFVDSDARPAENWLRDLIAPLRDENIGAATGYRWFISRKGNFASELRGLECFHRFGARRERKKQLLLGRFARDAAPNV